MSCFLSALAISKLDLFGWLVVIVRSFFVFVFVFFFQRSSLSAWCRGVGLSRGCHTGLSRGGTSDRNLCLSILLSCQIMWLMSESLETKKTWAMIEDRRKYLPLRWESWIIESTVIFIQALIIRISWRSVYQHNCSIVYINKYQKNMNPFDGVLRVSIKISESIFGSS